MNVFEGRDNLINDYREYVESFIRIRDARIKKYVDNVLAEGALWPEPLIQLNPSFEPGKWIDELVKDKILHEECGRIFRIKRREGDWGKPLRLHKHQSDAIGVAKEGESFVLTTGTGSGKSLAYIIPIVDYVLRKGSGKGIKAIIVYPMNALANSQQDELSKFLGYGYGDGKEPVTFKKYTGQESEKEKRAIIENPPDILLTNYVMLELILTRPEEKPLIKAAQGLEFLVLDELHTYRGRQGADVAFLVRRVRETLAAYSMKCIGTSATLAGEGNFEEQQEHVAEVATELFGIEIKPENVIGETLRRVTPELDINDRDFIDALRQKLQNGNYEFPKKYSEFIKEPLSIWVESTFGLTREKESGKLIRSKPRSIFGPDGAARELSELTGVGEKLCAEGIQKALMAGYQCDVNPETGFAPFAFRLHQFISKGDTVYTSLETEAERHITIYGQRFVPGNREKILLPISFCRECGQEYYSVRLTKDEETGKWKVEPRELTDLQNDDESTTGFLYFNSQNPWPMGENEIIQRLPDDWIETVNGKLGIRKNRKPYLPRIVKLGSDGIEDENGLEFQFVPAPFHFCLNCGVSYGIRQRSDFAKLSTLSSEGRSTATTILSLSAIEFLEKQKSLKDEAKKLLSFTDNRQDASLQAGHFNDFIEIGLLRSALYRAVKEAGSEGLKHDNLAIKVFEALNLRTEAYSSNPEVRFQRFIDTKKALLNVLGYRLYLDLRRGWRITSPNLEQCGLLEIKYKSLDDICEAEDLWEKRHPLLAAAKNYERRRIIKVLLDYMRRELAIKVDYLNADYQEKMQQQSSQLLIAPWNVDEDERMVHAAILYPRPMSKRKDYSGNVFLSARGGYGQYLRRKNTFEAHKEKISLDETQLIIRQLMEILRSGGLVDIVEGSKGEEDVPGYQLNASVLQWMEGDGTKAFHDPIRVPKQPAEGGKTNPFFLNFYKAEAGTMPHYEAREHTAQVPYEDRREREERFKAGKLPIMYCSPTMELGVDIAQLNIVNMRNVPPTPANYAQRSGRAGRSGQPALVYTYCSTGSPHDQYFFKRPELMVAGSVTPPRIDLSNEDLVRAHIHAIWLSETGLRLGKSLKDILDLSGDEPSLELLDEVKENISSKDAIVRARTKAEQVIGNVENILKKSDWYNEKWLDGVFNNIEQEFDAACNRWRTMYRSALAQAKIQDKIIRDATRSKQDKRRAERLRREAESQLKLLVEVENVIQSDFYSYRYFASEGFLPGYNFPRLPISAYIPGRRRKQRDEFLSRPRFLAISEFGPQTFIYHEGSRYVINKAILPVKEETLSTGSAKICPNCGYVHPITDGVGKDTCEMCGSLLEDPLKDMFRLQNVATKRRDKITSDEEERARMGYELLTGVRFKEEGGVPSYKTGIIKLDEKILAKVIYGDTATIWRINLGWRRRKEKSKHGFLLDVERGLWERRMEEEKIDEEDNLSKRVQRVIPYVEDRRNSILFEPTEELGEATMASLESALKVAILAEYQLEDNELAVEPLPSRDNRRLILIYEASEGGAGVLKRILHNGEEFSKIAKRALEICHFDPETGEDLRRAPKAKEDCEAACYDCLLNYGNQPDHDIIDRHLILNLLLQYSKANVSISPSRLSRAKHLEQLKKFCESELEKKWLDFLEKNNLRFPSEGQALIKVCNTRPDFLYRKQGVAVYVDGAYHDFPERRERDKEKTECLEDNGYTVIRFGHQLDWGKIVNQYPYVFGRKI